MEISREIIEKYHKNECSTEEAAAVEAWLFSADCEEALLLPLNESKTKHKADIWNEIEKTIQIDTTPAESGQNTFHKMSFWFGTVAASLFFAIMAFTGYYMNNKKEKLRLVAVNNTSSINIRHVEADAYHISVGTNTSARINDATGIVNLSGSILIRPKKDIILVFEGNEEKITFKAGQTYIVLKGEDGNDKVIVVNERNIMDLPPVLQKQIINEFKI